MDKESLSNSKGERSPCSKYSLLVTAVLVVCVIFSSFSMVMSILTYHRAGMRGDVDPTVVQNDHTWMREAIAELELKFETEGLMHFSKHRGNKTLPDDPLETARKQRDTDTDSRETEYNAMCNSTSGNYNDSLPIAHIVPRLGSGDYQPIIDPEDGRQRHKKPAIVATRGWTCGRQSQHSQFGVIAGGMVFNRSSGFLILPTDGVYYIYSHVQFRLNGTDTTFQTGTFMVACVPGEQCETVESNAHFLSRLLESSDTVSRSYNRPRSFAGENGIFQGGLFHFPANTQISVLVEDPKWQRPSSERRGQDKLFLSLGTAADSYMGAFLVQKIPFSS